MAEVSIRETTIETGGDGTTVRLRISDAKPLPSGETVASIDLSLLVVLPHYKPPYVFQLQYEALTTAREVLGKLAESVLQDVPSQAHARPTVQDK